MGQLALIEISKLTHSHGGNPALFRNLSFSISPGECGWLSGPNGSGKSTLIRLILGLEKPKAGTIRLGFDKKQAAYLPQLQNLQVHIPLTLWDVIRISVTPKPTEGQTKKVGLLTARHLHLAWNSASGGERSRCMLTIALLQNPRVLILDEPLNHLDQDSRKRIIAAISEFLKTDGGTTKAALIVSHEDLTATELKSAVRKHVQLTGNGNAVVS